jgi:hypothetical protein
MLLIVRGVILKSQLPLLPSAVGASSRGADARSLSFLGCCALLSLLMITSHGACVLWSPLHPSLPCAVLVRAFQTHHTLLYVPSQEKKVSKRRSWATSFTCGGWYISVVSTAERLTMKYCHSAGRRFQARELWTSVRRLDNNGVHFYRIGTSGS